MSYGNIIVTVKCKIELVEVGLIVFTDATVVKTTEATAYGHARHFTYLRHGHFACTTFRRQSNY